MERQRLTIDISLVSLLRVVAVLAIAAFLFFIRDLLVIIFFAILLILILQPGVKWLSQRGIPRVLSVGIIYLILLAVIAAVISLMIPPLLEQIAQMSIALDQYSGRIFNLFGVESQTSLGNFRMVVSEASKYFPSATQDLVSRLTGAVGTVISFFLVLVITFYGLVEEQSFGRIVKATVPLNYQPYLYHLGGRIQDRLGMWVRGQLILALVIFLLTFIGLSLLGVKYALVLALISGILELIPYIGPFISGTLAVFLNIFISPVKALLIVALYFVIQMLENHILVPKVMQKATGLNPLVSVLSLLVGAKVGGAVGVILAIPLANVISVLLEDIFIHKRFESITNQEIDA